MSDERVPAHVQTLWQDQPVEGGRMSLDELRYRSQRLTRIIGRRNTKEYAAGAVVIVMFGYMAFVLPLPIMRVGAAMSVAGAMFIIYHLHRHGTARAMPADLGLTSCLQFHRAELERQRDLLRGVWKWYLGPLIPGMILFYLGPLLAHPERAANTLWMFAGTVAFFALIGEWNRRVAKRYQAGIDALERNL